MAKVTIDIDAVDNASRVIKKTGLSLTDFKSGVDMVTTALAGMYEMGKKAYDIGKLGAQVTQTTKSFDGLIKSIGATPDLLNELREASNDTIPDMQLMSATTTLLAGAEGDLATALANATPKLLEIAKAANKLNPSLGDTTFMYNSLATGVKRASPLMIDNLGIKVKIGEANEKMAASLGKTVEQLTSEEQQMALLNETLRAGNVLIAQAGGAADSATDSFAKLETTITNIKNNFAAGFITEGNLKSLDLFAENLKDLSEGVGVFEVLAENQKKYARIELEATNAAMKYTDAEKRARDAHAKNAAAIEDVTEASEELEPAVKQATQTNVLARDAASEAARAYDEYWRKVNAAKQASEDLTAAQLNLQGAQANFREGVGQDFGGMLEGELEAGRITAEEYEAALSAIDSASGTHLLTDKQMADAQAELVKQFSAGAISAEEFRKGIEEFQNIWEPFNEDIEEAQRKVAYLQDMLDRLEGTYYINIEVSGAGGGAGGSVGDQERNYNVDLNGNGIIGARTGLSDFVVPPGYDETNGRPFLVAASSGETINVDPGRGRNGSGGNTYNLTIRTEQSPRVVQRGFAIERALAGV